ncbi:MAG: GrpB family protein [Caldilineaceae bacterium]
MMLASSPWQTQFEQERTRLRTALGEITEGGIIEGLQHIGATSVPGLLAQPCVDIGLAVWPFPLEPQPKATLAALGYQPITGHEDAPEQRFHHANGNVQLYLVEPGSARWTDYLLLRDYLRHTESARQHYSALKQAWQGSATTESAEYQTAKGEFFQKTLPAAHEWRVHETGFAPVEAVAQELKDFPCPWYISSGWALDLFLGLVRRVHHDVDVVVARADQLVLQKYMTAREWKFVTPYEKRLELWPPYMRLELPRFQAHAHRKDDFIDFLLTDITNSVWHYRREPSIVQTIERSTLVTQGGIPFLAPELVLLFKSKNTSGQARDKDQIDFAEVNAHLEPVRRAWLRWALLATNPTHPWLEQL